MEIRQTTDYELFKLFPQNRTVGTSKNLKKSIETIDLTAYCPIIVNKQFYIIDGQNRFHVCKDMGLPIYYVIYDGDEDVAMIALNTALRPWRQEEWLHYYVAKNFDNYKKLKMYVDKYGFQLSNSILLFSNSKTESSNFKKGKLIDDSSMFDDVAEFIINSNLPSDIKKYRAFVSAVNIFFHKKEKKEIDKLRKKILAVQKYARISDFLIAFENLIR